MAGIGAQGSFDVKAAPWRGSVGHVGVAKIGAH
jgi:hypothetical protein